MFKGKIHPERRAYQDFLYIQFELSFVLKIYFMSKFLRYPQCRVASQ